MTMWEHVTVWMSALKTTARVMEFLILEGCPDVGWVCSSGPLVDLGFWTLLSSSVSRAISLFSSHDDPRKCADVSLSPAVSLSGLIRGVD